MKEILIIGHPIKGNTVPGSLLINGYQLSQYINNKVSSKCACLDVNQISSLKDTHIVFLGTLTDGLGLNEEVLLKLKKQGNTTVINPIDDLCYKTEEELQREVDMYNYVDGVIFPNKFAKEYFQETYNKSRQSTYLPHPYDSKFDKLEINQTRPFKVVYGGSHYNNRILNNPPSWLEVNQTGHTDSVLQLLTNSPIHFSHREDTSIDFYFKPSTKLSSASACEAVMIMSKDKSYIDLVPDYPLYVDNTIEDVNEKYELAKSWYGTGKWKELLELMTEVRVKTSLDTISKQYIKYLNEL